jgi:cyclic pyranopterin phosphate synthase
LDFSAICPRSFIWLRGFSLNLIGWYDKSVLRRPRNPLPSLTHLDKRGRAHMVDVSAKPATARRAVAEGFISVAPATLRAITAGRVPKGEVLNTARIAAILAAKRTGELIPLCHPLPVESVKVEFDLPRLSGRQRGPVKIRIVTTATITAKTGVEMEALTAVALAALTIYDMCKAIDKTMTIEGIRLLSKTGGTK